MVQRQGYLSYESYGGGYIGLTPGEGISEVTAGIDQTRNEGETVQLNGAQSNDPDGDSLSFTWTQFSGSLVTLLNPSSSTPYFLAPPVVPGGEALTFRLVVNDGQLDSDPDYVTINIINVNDPPRCELAGANPPILWPPNHKLIPVQIVNVTDPNNDQVTITITGVTQDEPVNGLGDGDTSPDAVIEGNTVYIRAERSGRGNGRVYNINFRAVYSFAESCTGFATVCVPHDMRGSLPVVMMVRFMIL